MSNKRKSIVMLGGFGHEGIFANVKSLGLDLLRPNIEHVKPKTWMKRAAEIEHLRQSDSLAAVVIYLHTTLFLNATRNEYRQPFLSIIQNAKPEKVIVFVFQDNLDGIFSMRHRESRKPMTLAELQTELDSITEKLEFKRMRLENVIERLKDYEDRKNDVEDFLRTLYSSGAEVAPFYIRSDVTIRLQEFLADVERGVFLRLFVPDDRFQADQLKNLLSVLERYLKQVERMDFSIDARRSEKGIVYIFKSIGALASLNGLNEAFGRFDSFMRLCGDDPSQAETILRNVGIGANETGHMVAKYSRDYQRLMLDTRHEFERKTLILRQQLEGNLVEMSVGTPTIEWSGKGLEGLLSTAATGGNITVNIDNVSVLTANGIQGHVQQLINGVSIEYGTNDRQLLDLFDRYADRLESLQCRSDLDQLKDKSTPEPARHNAKQRLVGFLRKAATKAADIAEKIAVEALSKYLESLLNG